MLAIIGKNDKVLFSLAVKQAEVNPMHQFLIHASLDLIEQRAKRDAD